MNSNLILLALFLSAFFIFDNPKVFSSEAIGSQEDGDVAIRRERRRGPYHRDGSPDGRRRYHHGGFHRSGYHHGGHNHGDRIWDTYNNQYWGQRIFDYNWANFELGGDGFGYGYWSGAGPWVSNTGEFPGYIYMPYYYYYVTPVPLETSEPAQQYYYETSPEYQYYAP